MVKNPPTSAGDAGSIPGSGRSLGVGNGNPVQYRCLEEFHGQRSLAATGHVVAKSWTRLGARQQQGLAEVESFSICPFLTGLFHLAQCPQASSLP